MQDSQKYSIIYMIVGLGSSTCIPLGDTFSRDIRIEPMSGFPDGESGYDLGVSGCYAGRLGDSLIIAGGCNFPDKPLSEEEGKRYYKGVHVARMNDSFILHWMRVGSLSMEAVYGAAVSSPGKLVFTGGSNSSSRLPSVLSFSSDCMKELGVAYGILSSPPCAFDNISVTLLGDTLYVLGGYRNGIPSCSTFSFCSSNRSGGWTETFFPGKPRVQPVCASLFDSSYIWGGSIPDKESSVSTDGLCYRPVPGQRQVPRAPLTTED